VKFFLLTKKELRKNLNEAEFNQLTSIPGISTQMANEILEHIPYESWEEVENLRGIGKKRLSLLKEYFRLL